MRKAVARAWSSNEFELFVAVLCTVVGLPLAVGVAPSPNSIAAALPNWTLFFWGLSLSLGGLCTVIGILIRYTKPQQFVTGLLTEKAGMYMLGSASSVLCLAIGVFAGAVGMLSAGIFGALALACVTRIRTINKEASIVKEHGEG
jgi:hypothetical protein